MFSDSLEGNTFRIFSVVIGVIVLGIVLAVVANNWPVINGYFKEAITQRNRSW